MAEPVLTVAGLVERGSGAGPAGLALELLSGHRGLERRIASPYIQKTGLALAGFHEYLRPGRIVVFGESEVRYLESLTHDARMDVLDTTFTHDIPCVLITGGWEAHDRPAGGRRAAPGAAAADIGLHPRRHFTRSALCSMTRSPFARSSTACSWTCSASVSSSSATAASARVSARSIWSSVVIGWLPTIRCRSDGGATPSILGACPEPTRYHMELRGLGIINIRDLFGVASTRASKRVELVVQLERWDGHREYDRLGLDENVYELFGVRVPLICMPVAPGRNLATLVEVAARNQLLKSRGLNAARDSRATAGAATPGRGHRSGLGGRASVRRAAMSRVRSSRTSKKARTPATRRPRDSWS